MVKMHRHWKTYRFLELSAPPASDYRGTSRNRSPSGVHEFVARGSARLSEHFASPGVFRMELHRLPRVAPR